MDELRSDITNHEKAAFREMQHRKSYLVEKSRRATKQLQLVRIDIINLIKVTSLGGHRYFITFVDGFSKITSVYFLEEKTEAFEKFKKFKAMTET